MSSDEGHYDGDISSNEDEYDCTPENVEDFVKDHIYCLFDPTCEISFEDKFKFGELLKTSTARLAFAKYMNAHRSRVKCVDESTFYKLIHSFALVLFECAEADDYRPGKTLMNMAFTYFCNPHSNTQVEKSNSGVALNDKDNKGFKTKRKSNSSKFLKVRKLQKEIGNIRQAIHDNTAIQRIKLGIIPTKKMSKSEDREDTIAKIERPTSEVLDLHPDFFKSTEKQFLYERLKYQKIWKSRRFWDEAFLVAVHDQTKTSCSGIAWGKLSHEEREQQNNAIANITFGLLLNFTNNMKSLDLSNAMCREFIKKHCVIGGISENSQYRKILMEKILT